jgi:hypothetical protein
LTNPIPTQTSPVQHFQLTPFDPLPVEFNLSVGGHIARPNAETIQIHYQITGDLNAIVIPQRQNPPVRRDELWTTTCLELFIGEKDMSPYWEFNLSHKGTGTSTSSVLTEVTSRPTWPIKTSPAQFTAKPISSSSIWLVHCQQI